MRELMIDFKRKSIRAGLFCIDFIASVISIIVILLFSLSAMSGSNVGMGSSSKKESSKF